MREIDAMDEAIDCLSSAVSDCLLVSQACMRFITVTLVEDQPCRFCGSDGDAHAEGCPLNLFMDISHVLFLEDEYSRESILEFLERTAKALDDRKKGKVNG